jgi:hypothetical protein
MNSGTELQPVVDELSGVDIELQHVDAIYSGFTPKDPEGDDVVKAENDGNLHEPSGVGMDSIEVHVSVKKQDVNDDHQEAKDTSPPENPPSSTTKLNYIVLAIILIAAIIFAAFQIRECAAAHSNPGVVSRSLERVRVFPGLMICPYATPETFYGPPDYCPNWEKDASLSFKYGNNPPVAFNTNVNFRETGTSQSVCKMNIKKSSKSITSTGAWLPLIFGKLGNFMAAEADMSFAQEVIIKNTPGSIDEETDCQEGKCVTSTCLTWTPPNVKCLVYDPFVFDKLAVKYGMDPKCNPMKETVPNSFDSFQLALNIADFDPTATGGGFSGLGTDKDQGFQYEGLIPQQTYTIADQVDEAPSRFISFFDMQQRFKSSGGGSGMGEISPFTLNATFFGGLMVVLYDPTEGIPKQMDFKSAPLIVDNNEGSFKISQTLIYKNFNFNNQNGVAEYKYFQPIGPIVVAVDSAIEKTFTNAVLQQMRETMKYFLSFSFSNDKKNKYDSRRFDISLQFVSGQTSITEEVVKISILTTVSIILSTTATLWGARENIAEGLLLIATKARVFLQNRK